MNCLVSGGAGFIGSHLTRRLLADGFAVTVIDNLVEGKRENLPLDHPRLTFLERSILERFSFPGEFELVFHLAALPRVQRSIADPWETNRVNVEGTLNLLMLARDHGAKKFVFSSSSSVYGDQRSLPFVEAMVPNPLSPYGLQKWVGEQYCLLFTRIFGLPAVCLRYFNVYGPGMMPDGAYANLMPKFVQIIRNGGVPVINGDGEQTRDFTYVGDVVEANVRAAQSGLSGEVVNIGYGKAFSVNQVSRLILDRMGSDTVPAHGPAVVEPRKTLADISKAGELLGWKPVVDMERGLAELIDESKIREN